MKNLPNKIYLNFNMTPQEVVETKDKDFHEATKTWEITWSEERLSKHDPEYVYKDAFIDKACGFLYNYNKKQVLKHGARATLGCGEYTINVDDFRNYMKGE